MKHPQFFITQISKIISILGIIGLFQLSVAADVRDSDSFFLQKSSQGADLPADQFYPLGKKMVFAGYSGIPERDLANGFTVGGPFYGNSNEEQSMAAIAEGRPCLVQVGISGPNMKGIEAAAKLPKEEIQELLKAQIQKYVAAEKKAGKKSIVWWCLQPEELRPWRKNEMRFLKIATETIRATDPAQRPIYLYNPNHRNSETLKPIAPHVDIMAKGCYVNYAGYKDQRGWIRYSMEEMLKAHKARTRPGYSIVMPEMAQDPEPENIKDIESWCRHDIYLGLMSGAKGVLIWSLFKRPGIRKTWEKWYDSYAQVGRELNGPDGLSGVFLFGEPRHEISVTPQESRTTSMNAQGKKVEENTSRDDESAKAQSYPVSKTEYVYEGTHYLFLANSYPEPTHFLLTGIPNGCKIVNAFSQQDVTAEAQPDGYKVRLEPWEILAWKISPSDN